LRRLHPLPGRLPDRCPGALPGEQPSLHLGGNPAAGAPAAGAAGEPGPLSLGVRHLPAGLPLEPGDARGAGTAPTPLPGGRQPLPPGDAHPQPAGVPGALRAERPQLAGREGLAPERGLRLGEPAAGRGGAHPRGTLGPRPLAHRPGGGCLGPGPDRHPRGPAGPRGTPGPRGRRGGAGRAGGGPYGRALVRVTTMASSPDWARASSKRDRRACHTWSGGPCSSVLTGPTSHWTPAWARLSREWLITWSASSLSTG